jgi:hypothetical protein
MIVIPAKAGIQDPAMQGICDKWQSYSGFEGAIDGVTKTKSRLFNPLDSGLRRNDVWWI